VIQWAYVPFQVQPLLATQLAAPLVVDGEPRYTDPDVVAALQWLADLFILHEVSPWFENYKPFAQHEAAGGPDPLSLVREGRAAMWSADHTVWQFGFKDERIGLATMPRSQQGYAADAGRYSFAISRGAAQPQAAWQLLAFLSRQPPVSDSIGLLVPARRSVAAAIRFWESVPAALAVPLQYAAENNTTPRLTPTVSEAMRSALTAVVERNESAATALIQVQAAAEAEATTASVPVVATAQTESAAVMNAVTEIIFIANWNDTEAQRKLATAFNQIHPGIKVTVRRRDAGEHEIAGADCFAASPGVTRNHAAVLPLNALIDLDPELNQDDFYPATITVLTQQGQLLGIPGQIAAPLIGFNRGIFATAGVDEPPLEWSLTEFLDTAQALTDPTTERYGFVDWSQELLFLTFAQFGIDPVSESDGLAIIDYAAAAPVVHWYADVVRLHGIHPILPGDLISWQDYFDRHNLFLEMIADGRAAMWLHSDSDRALREQLRLAGIEAGLATFPRGPSGDSFNVAHRLTGYFIAADTLHPQLCWQWLKFLATQLPVGDSVPAHITTAESAAFADHVGAERAAILLASITGGSDLGVRLALVEEWLHPGLLWLTVLMETSAKGETDVDSALEDAANKFARYRECVIDRQAFNNAAEWRDCAIEVDANLSHRYD
jgi:ABC-type glycerol-3-phosphate transport system substrate-binding protein